MLGQRRRRWANNKTSVFQRVVLAGDGVMFSQRRRHSTPLLFQYLVFSKCTISPSSHARAATRDVVDGALRGKMYKPSEFKFYQIDNVLGIVLIWMRCNAIVKKSSHPSKNPEQVHFARKPCTVMSRLITNRVNPPSVITQSFIHWRQHLRWRPQLIFAFLLMIYY